MINVCSYESIQICMYICIYTDIFLYLYIFLQTLCSHTVYHIPVLSVNIDAALYLFNKLYCNLPIYYYNNFILFEVINVFFMFECKFILSSYWNFFQLVHKQFSYDVLLCCSYWREICPSGRSMCLICLPFNEA